MEPFWGRRCVYFCFGGDSILGLSDRMMSMVNVGSMRGRGHGCCVGAGVPLGARALWLVLLLLFSLFTPVGSVCPHCKDTILGCKGGTSCPTLATVASNGKIFSDKTIGSVPVLCSLLPPSLAAVFSRPVCEAIVAIALAPTSGTVVDFSDAAYTHASAVVQAANYGYVSVGEALGEINRRIQEATETLEVTKLRGALDILNKDDAVDLRVRDQGIFTFIWAKLSQWVGSVSNTVKLNTGPESKSKSLTATLKRPGNSSHFFMCIHWFILVVSSLGLAAGAILSRFFGDVVFDSLEKLKLKWEVAHELVLIYFREMEQDPTGFIHFGNVFRRGGQDTFIAEAKSNAQLCFRTGGGAPQPSGKFNDKSDKACAAFNNGKPCTRLDDAGACIFNHRCNQFVSDKGTGGICFGNHARCVACDYDPAKKLSAAKK